MEGSQGGAAANVLHFVDEAKQSTHSDDQYRIHVVPHLCFILCFRHFIFDRGGQEKCPGFVVLHFAILILARAGFQSAHAPEKLSNIRNLTVFEIQYLATPTPFVPLNE